MPRCQSSTAQCVHEADNERRVNVMHPLSAYPLHTIVIQRKKEKKEKQNNFKSAIPLAIPFTGIATISTGGGCQLNKEVTCTYLHHTKPHILSLFFLSPTLSLPLSAIFWTAGNTSATPCPWGCSRTLPPAWHGTTKAKAIWVHWQRLVNHPQPWWHPTFHSLIYMGTNDVEDPPWSTVGEH